MIILYGIYSIQNYHLFLKNIILSLLARIGIPLLLPHSSKCTFYHDIASDLIETPFETGFADAHFPLLLHHPVRRS